LQNYSNTKQLIKKKIKRNNKINFPEQPIFSIFLLYVISKICAQEISFVLALY